MSRTRFCFGPPKARLAVAALVAASALLGACRQDMHDQPRYEPLEQSRFFSDQRAARPLPEGTVARGDLREDDLLYRGKIGGKFADRFPFPVTREVLERGRERYDIYCSPCHDRTGSGTGMIVRRGYLQPPSFHIERLRKQVPGYFFNAITNGFGKMPSYAMQIPVRDRWAIVAYVRALQLSQHATLADVPPAERVALEAEK
ncbi:MAG: cytochrome c [Candidatus Dadabacteria bacterium]|nr:MAG: cytochrome c [Candidatus Dadabacteria bacterium]